MSEECIGAGVFMGFGPEDEAIYKEVGPYMIIKH